MRETKVERANYLGIPEQNPAWSHSSLRRSLIVAAITIKSAFANPMQGIDQTQEEPVSTNARDTQLLQLREDESVVGKGKEVYTLYCLACHGPEGLAIDSPSNLFDSKWYQHPGPSGIETSIREGVLEKGMPAWGQMVSNSEIESVVAYLLSFQPKKPTTDD